MFKLLKKLLQVLIVYHIFELILFKKMMYGLQKFRFGEHGFDFDNGKLSLTAIEKLNTINEIIDQIEEYQLSPWIDFKKQLSITLIYGRYAAVGIPLPYDYYFCQQYDLIVDIELLHDDDLTVNEWKSVFAHELGHIALKHIGFKVLIYQLFPFLNQPNEYEADAFSLHFNNDCYDLINFIDKVENKIGFNQEKDFHPKAIELEKKLRPWLSTHPSNSDRQSALIHEGCFFKDSTPNPQYHQKNLSL